MSRGLFPFGIALALVALAPTCFAGTVVVDNGRYRYLEDFRWQGNHAATIGGGTATTTWWPEKDWDGRGDTAFIAVEPGTDDGQSFTNRFHVDIHKAASADPRSGVLDNTVYAVGGNGAPGIGIMHVDYQDVVSARLRNPMLVTAQQPGVVTFFAPLFNTSGHWWEVAITPADSVVGGEHTSVPTVDQPLPFAGSTAAQPGPGHDSPTPSLNVVSIGSADYPCLPGNGGWRTRFGVTRNVGGVRTQYVTPTQGPFDYLPTDPAQANTLVQWRITYFTDHVSLDADLDGDGTFTALESWPASIPWGEVHVHLLAVGYQSTHHPDDECNLGPIREIQWRNLSVYPVKFAATDVFPKNVGTQQLGRELGFTGYDLRDIQRFGAPVNGVPQPNLAAFSSNHPGRWCADAGFPCFAATTTTPSLAFTLPAAALVDLRDVVLVADLKDAAPVATHASVLATLNGQSLGRFPEHDAVLPDPNEWPEWVRRSLPVAANRLNAGANTLALALEPGAYVDRIELELRYGEPLGTIFADGYESTSRAMAKAWANPAMGSMHIESSLFPVGTGAHLLHQCAE
ncbi:MAG TPA: hypothetical protein VFL14_04915 [Xanthomonadales bacterium]|nr:hypothetical protein [Xanthomonadales bacterium]